MGVRAGWYCPVPIAAKQRFASKRNVLPRLSISSSGNRTIATVGEKSSRNGSEATSARSLPLSLLTSQDSKSFATSSQVTLLLVLCRLFEAKRFPNIEISFPRVTLEEIQPLPQVPYREMIGSYPGGQLIPCKWHGDRRTGPRTS